MTNRIQRCVSAACLVALSGGAWAQSKGASAPGAAVQEAVKGPAAPLEKFGEKNPEGARFDLSFSGGTLDDYVTLLRSVAGATANLVVTSEVEDLPIGKVSLRQVTVPDAVQVIETASRQSGDRVTAAALERHGEIWVVRATTNTVGRAAAQRSGAPGRVEVFNITGAAGPSTPAETTLSAVEAAVRLIDRPGSQTQISFHKESGLLFVMGTEEAQESVRNVVRGIGANRDVAMQRVTAEGAASLLGLLGAGDMKSAHDRVKELLAAGKEMDHQKVESAVAMARVEAESRMMQVQAKQLQDRVVQLTDQAQKAEQMYRAKLDELEMQRMAERREMLDQIEQLRKALDSAKASK